MSVFSLRLITYSMWLHENISMNELIFSYTGYTF